MRTRYFLPIVLIIFTISIMLIRNHEPQYNHNVEYVHTEYKPGFIDPSLVDYVDEWKVECDSRGIMYDLSSTTIQVNNNLESSTQGITYYNLDLIEINRDVLTEWQERFVVYHELGHYVFGYDHLDNDNWIMAYGCNSEENFKYSWEEMKEQYFNMDDNVYIGY